ncbi:MAG: 50S ribosomal protein L3 N(5)-glutamine methyltransferase [Proteobacteria bacterium]|nr:50S ribosomal protein L3 N(5)-glutamine methyltransferase [Pseudomonadota bacterium]
MADSEALKGLFTIRDFIRWGSSEFNRRSLTFGHGFVSAIDEAKYLTLYALDLPYDWPETYFDCALMADERERVTEILKLRAGSRQPAAYITHESWFCGLKFYVDERVLVPRSPIAELISNRFGPWIDSDRVTRILDLCTGSACIAIACQYAFPDAEVRASDISLDALEVARINCRNHNLDDHLTLYESDLLDQIPPQQFDIIVSNPPYVDAEEMAALTDEFRFEPAIGLAAGSDGLALVDRILSRAGDYLSECGVLIIEVGNSQAAMMEKYSFLPMTWLEFEFGGDGVCCIQSQDLRQQYQKIEQITDQLAMVQQGNSG